MWYYEIMTFQSGIIVIKKIEFRNLTEKKNQNFLLKKSNMIDIRTSIVISPRPWTEVLFQSCATICRSLTLKFSFTRFQPFRLKEPSIRSVCSRGLPFGSLLHSLRTITRFEDMIFLERREDVYMIRSDVSTWMYFVLAQNVVLVTFGTSDKL